MRLLIHDTLVTAPYTAPLAAGWVEPSVEVAPEVLPVVRSVDVRPDDAALLPAPEAARLGNGWLLVPGIAAVSTMLGAVSLRTPVRPDEVDNTTIRLLDCSASAEVLARATVRQHFGIAPMAWTTDDAMAQAVVVEGAAAARPPEGGFAEDLTRAWFILTGLPVVTHLLAVPAGAAPEEIERVSNLLAAARTSAGEQQKTWRSALAKRDDIPREQMNAIYTAQRLSLLPDDRRALVALLSHAGRGTPYPVSPVLNWLG